MTKSGGWLLGSRAPGDDAGDALLRALDASGRLDEAAFADLERELVDREAWSALAALYPAAAVRAADSETGRSLWLSAGLLRDEKLGDPAGAEPWLRRVLASDPESLEALRALARGATVSGRFAEAALLLERALSAAPPEAAADVALELAEVAAARLGEPERALAGLWRAHERAPERRDVLSRAREIFLAEDRPAEAAAVLEAEAGQLLGDRMEALAASTGTSTLDVGGVSAEAIEELAAAHREVGERLVAHAVHHPLARTVLERARTLGDEAALALLDTLEARAQGWAERAAEARDRGLSARDKREAAAAYLEAAELHLVYGQDDLRAEEQLERALLLIPGHSATLRILEAVELARGGHARLGARLNAMVGAVRDPEVKVRILLSLARVAEAEMDEAGEDEAAAAESAETLVDALRRAHAAAPAHPEVTARLAGVLGEMGRHEARAEALERFLGAAKDPDVALETHLELGRVAAEELGDAARARVHFEAALSLRPGEFEAASALRALYKDARERPLLLGVLEVLAESAPDLDSRLALVSERLEVAREISPEEAFWAARARFELDPDLEGAEEELVALGEATGRLEALAETFEAAARLRPGARGAALWRRAAELFDERAPQASRAAHAYRRALELDPDDAASRDALERLLRSGDDPGALAEVLRSRIRAADDPAERRVARAKLAEVLERGLDDVAGAIEVHEATLAEAPEDASALFGLASLYEREGRDEALEAVLARLERLETDPVELAALRARRAGALVALDRRGEAEALWLEVLPVSPELAVEPLEAQLASQGAAAPEIAAALEAHYARRGLGARRRDVLEILREAAPDASARSRAALEAARLSVELGDLERAVDGLLLALSASPDDPALLERLLELAPKSEQARAIDEGLAAALERAEGPARGPLASALGELREQVLDAPEAALDAYRALLEAEPGSPVALRALERTAAASGRHAELGALLEAQLEGASEPEVRARHGLALAELREQRLADPGGALAAYRAVLEEVPGEPTALGRLATRLPAAEAPAELVAVLERLRETTSEPSAAAALDVRVGDVLRLHLGDAPGAFERYTRALETGGARDDVVAGLEALLENAELRPRAGTVLEPIHAERDDAAGLVRALEARAEAADPAERGEILLRAAELRAERLDDAGGALEGLLEAFGRGELGAEAAHRLTALAVSAGAPGRLADAARARAAAARDAELWRFFAKLATGEAARPGDAREGWERVLEHAPGDEEALEALESLTAAGDDPSALAAVLEARAEAQTDPAERARFFRRAASIWEEAADDPEAALRVLGRAQEAAPEDRTAFLERARIEGSLGRAGPQADALREAALRTDAAAARSRGFVEEARVRLAIEDGAGLEDALRALERALEATPDHREARQLLEVLLEGPGGARAALALEPAYRRAGDWGQLAAAYRILAERSSDPQERVERWVAIRSLEEERLGRLDEAREAARAAFLEAPGRTDLQAAFERLSVRTGRAETLSADVREAAERAEGEDRPRLLAAAARFADEHALDPAEAARAWGALAAARPDDAEALRRLSACLGETGDAEGQIDALERLGAVLEGPERAQALVAAGRAAEAAERPGAGRLFEAALVAAPGDVEAIEGLRRTRGDDPGVIAEALERALPHLAGAGRGRALLELGRLRAEALDHPEGALEAFSAVLALEGVGELRDAAAHALDALVEDSRGDRPQIALRAAAAVEPFWAEKGAWHELIQAKEARSEASDPEGRARVRREIAEVYETRLARPEMAFLTLGRAFLEAPEDEALAADLERLAEAAHSLEEWAELNVEALSDAIAPELRLTLARRAARITDRGLGRGPAAAPFYERVLGLAPGDEEALDALERIQRESGEPRGLVAALRARLETRELDDAEARARWAEIADLAENELGDPDLAAEALGALRRLAPGDVEVLRRLGALGERSDRPGLAQEALEAELEAADDDATRARLLLQLGALRRDRLDDPAGAVAAYARVLELRPEDPGAVGGLSSLLRGPASPAVHADAAEALAPTYLRHGAYEAYLECLERVAAGRTGEARRACLGEMAEVYETRLGRPERAFAAARRAFHEAPDDEVAAARVERLARENEMWEDLAALYLDEADAAEGDQGRALRYRRRVAEIYDQGLGDVERAIAEYDRVLDAAPGDSAALLALERLYAAAGRHERLAEVYRRRIAQADGEKERVRLMRAFARLQAEALGDAPGAIATLRRLTHVAPDDPEALEALSRLLEAEGRSGELADVLERLLAVDALPDAARLDAKVRLGRVRAEGQGDLVAADRLLGEALEIDPRHPGARDYLQERFEDAVAADDLGLARSTGEMLASALRAAGETEALASVLQLRVGLEPRAGERVPLELELAELQEGPLEAPELAFATLGASVRAAPGVEAARERFEALGARLRRPDTLVATYEAALPAATDGEVAEGLERRIAELLEPFDPSRAREAWRRVAERSPDDEAALAALDRLDTALGRWAALADVLERRAELAPSDEARHALLLRLGALWEEQLDEPEEAVTFYRKARELRPRDREALEPLGRLLDPEQAAPELAGVLEALAETAPDDRGRRRHEARLAALAAGPLGDPERAIHLWRGLLEEEPAHPEASRALEALYEQTGRWPELAVLLEAGLDRAQGDREVLRLQRKLGLVRGTRLGSVDDAVSSWQEILRRNPNDVEALEALAGIHRSAEQWEALVVTLRKLIPLQASADGVKSIRFELAEVLDERLGRREDAIESAKRVLDVEPHTPAELMRLEELFTSAGAHGEAVRVKTARAGQAETKGEKVEILFEVAELYTRHIRRRAGAVAAYEQILDLEPESTKAFEALSALFEEGGDYRRLVELRDRRLEVVEDPEARRRLLFSIVDVQERWLGHPELAFGAACRAFAEEGADARAEALAERLAAETDNWDLLVEVFEEQLDQVGAGRAADLRRRLGEIHLDHLDDPERAEHHFVAALALRPDDAAARERLRGLFERSGRWGEVVRLLGEEAESALDPARKRALLFEMARIEETERGDPEAAVASVKRVLDLDPEDDEALGALARLFRENARWHPLVSVLGRRLDRAGSEAERAALRFEIAEVTEKGLGDVSRAIDAYRDVLELEPAHRPSLDALERLFSQEENWTELIGVYEARIRAAASPDEAIELLSRVAGIHEERFGDLETAAHTLIRVLEIEPEHLPAVIRLERIWRAAGETEPLVEALGRHVELARAPEEASRLLVEIGQLHAGPRADAEAAQKAFLQALEAWPTNQEAVHALAELHEAEGRWYAALEMLAREVQLVGDAEASADLHFRMGKIDEEMLGEPAAAKQAYERAVEMNPGHGPALRALRALREEEGGYEEVVELEAQEAEHTRDPEEKARLYHHAAVTALDRFDDVPKAIRYLESGLAADPDHVPSLEVLSDLLFSEERFAEAEVLLERLVEKLDPTSDRGALGRLSYRLAYIAEKHGQPALALERYHASYEHDSTYLPTLEGLAGALMRAERWEDAQRVFQAILIQHKAALTDAEVVDVHYQIGDLAFRLDQLDRARKSFERALTLDPTHVSALWAYARLEEREERWEEAYDRRERLLELLADDDPDRMLALREQARLSEEKIREPWRAIDAYAEANRLVPDDAEILRALVRLYRETSQLGKAVAALGDLGLVLTAREERRDVYVEIARLHHEQQGDVTAAVEALNVALDIDPEHVDAFSRIEQMLFDARAWPVLEENYKRMLARVPKTQKKQRAILWRSLAELYTRALRDDEGARIAFEVLQKLEPEDREVQASLARIYARSPDAKGKAAELNLGLLPVADDPAEPARALFNLFFEAGMLDRSFCALGALILMSAADETERRAYKGLLRYVPRGPARPLTDTLWRERLLHPHCRGELGELASVVFRGAPQLFARRQRALALKPRKERVDLTDERKNAPAKLRYFDVWRSLQKVMHVPPAEHYLRPQADDAPRLVPGPEPVLFAGQKNEIFAAASSRSIAWTLGRQMAMSRPELALAAALDAEDVAACLEAAIRLVVPEGSGVDLGQRPEEIAGWQRLLGRHLSERARGALSEPAALVVENRRMKVLARFLRGVEHSANRAALLAAGDVEVATVALDGSEPLVPDVSHRARVRELMLFVLGVDHFELREKLGAKVAPQAEEAVRQRS